MIKRFYIFVLLLLIAFPLYSQKWKLTRYEAIVGIGTANYYGDIGGGNSENNLLGLKDVFSWNSIRNTGPCIYFGGRYKLQQDRAIKVNLIYGYFRDDDKGSINAQRDYSFRTHAIEPSVQYEYYFIQEERRKFSFAAFNRRGMMNNISKIGVYAFGGLGGVVYFAKFFNNYNPAVETVNTNKHITIAIPIGLGIKYIYSSEMAFGFELGRRYLTTDYFDGFTSKYSKYNDIYLFGVFNVVYRLRTDRNGYPVFRRW